jgi:hypothetical protein
MDENGRALRKELKRQRTLQARSVNHIAFLKSGLIIVSAIQKYLKLKVAARLFQHNRVLANLGRDGGGRTGYGF